MKLNQIQLFLATVVMMAAATWATPIPGKNSLFPRSGMNGLFDEETESGRSIMRRQKVSGTCLRVAPDLLPCNFDSQATWLSTSGEILQGGPVPGSESEVLAEYLNLEKSRKIQRGETENPEEDSVHKRRNNLREFENDLAIMIVYYLEGCLPSRLPFELPPCRIEDFQTIHMNKLVPFKLANVQDELIFPEIDEIKKMEFTEGQADSASSSDQKIVKTNARRNRVLDGSRLIISETKEDPKGVQDVHKMLAKSALKLRTGTASVRYIGTSSGMTSEFPWSSLKNKNRNKNKSIGHFAKDDVEDVEDKLKVDDREEEFKYSGSASSRDKNRVQ